jgi:hypothetical protein
MIKCIRIYDQLEKNKNQFLFVHIDNDRRDKYKWFYDFAINPIFDTWDEFVEEYNFEKANPSPEVEYLPQLNEFKQAYDEVFHE